MSSYALLGFALLALWLVYHSRTERERREMLDGWVRLGGRLGQEAALAWLQNHFNRSRLRWVIPFLVVALPALGYGGARYVEMRAALPDSAAHFSRVQLPQVSRDANGLITADTVAQFDGFAELPNDSVDFTVPATVDTITVCASGCDQTTVQGAWDSVGTATRTGHVRIQIDSAYAPGALTTGAQTGDDTYWVVISTDGFEAKHPRHVRVSPADTTSMAQWVCPDNGTSDWDACATIGAATTRVRFVGQSFKTPKFHGNGSSIVSMSDVDPDYPDGIIFDRVVMEGQGPEYDTRRGILIQGEGLGVGVIDSYMHEIADLGSDSQALLLACGSGPFAVVNNYLEGAGENMMTGGIDCANDAALPRDVTIARNFFEKDSLWADLDSIDAANATSDKLAMPAHAWTDGMAIVLSGSLPGGLSAGTRYYVTGAQTDSIQVESTEGGGAIDLTSSGTGEIERAVGVKNLFEIKHGYRFLVEDNIYKNNWSDSQTGFAILLKSVNQSGTAPHATTQDLIFRFNRIVNSIGGINIAGESDGQTSVGTKRAVLREVVAWNLTNDSPFADQGGDDRLLQILASGKFDTLQIQNLTLVGNQANTTTAFHGGTTDGLSYLQVQNVCLARGDFGWRGDASGEGTTALNDFVAVWDWEANHLWNDGSTTWGSSYPDSTTAYLDIDSIGFENVASHDYRLATGSPLKGAGTGGDDPCADVATINSRLTNVEVGDFSSDQWSS